MVSKYIKKREKFGSFNKSIIFLFLGFVILLILLIVTFNKMSLFEKKPRLDKESLDSFNNKFSECRLLNPGEEELCKDKAYFSVSISKGLNLCSYIKDNKLKEECVNTLK